MEVTQTQLPNGLKVILAPSEGQSVAVGVFVRVGSRNETRREGGISHFIEHMLFKGTKNRSAREIVLALEGRGGVFNAMTSEDNTCYYAHMPDTYLDQTLEVLADMYLNPAFAENEFANEKQVILEELKMYDDDPSSVLMEKLQAALYAKDSLGRPVGGTPETLKPLTATDLRRYFEKHYTSDSTFIVIVGHFNSAETLKHVETLFQLPKSRLKPLRRFTPVKPLKSVPAAVTARRDVTQLQLAIGYRMFGLDDPRCDAAAMLNVILGHGMSSRLFQEVREKRGLCYDISSQIYAFKETSYLAITAGLAFEKESELIKLVDREIARLTTRRVTAMELKRAKELVMGNMKLGMESTRARMFFYARGFRCFNRIVTLQERLDAVAAVTADDILAVAKEIFNPAMRCVSRVLPKQGGQS